jgi:hypothetical protein
MLEMEGVSDVQRAGAPSLGATSTDSLIMQTFSRAECALKSVACEKAGVFS